jgi:cation diffusion facilitator family transporter
VKIRQPFELPEEQQRERERAIRLERITLAVQVSVGVVLYLALGQSQAMKAAWIDDLLALVPPTAFLVATHFEQRPPNRRFPYGHYRAITSAFLIGSVVVAWVGASLLFDSVKKLVTQERTSIGTVELFGHQFWFGWLMLAALAYSITSEAILGHVKLPLAKRLHDKALYADATMNKAGWMSESAAAIGVIGLRFGLWWTDPVAASLIALGILREGWRNLRQAFSDLMDAAPRPVGSDQLDALPEKLQGALEELDWVDRAVVRLREEGHVLVGEAFIVPRGRADLTARIEEAVAKLKELDWRLYDLTIMPVRALNNEMAADESKPDEDE